jgi:hypothetical protein
MNPPRGYITQDLLRRSPDGDLNMNPHRAQIAQDQLSDWPYVSVPV